MTLFFVGRCVATAPKHPPVDVRFTPMCGRLRVGKKNLRACSLGRCGHVFGLSMRLT